MTQITTDMNTQASKRKYDDDSLVAAVEEFFNSISDRMKDMVKRTCYKHGCKKVHLGYGYPGEDKISCNKHFEEIEGLSAQGGKCILRGCDTKGCNKVKGVIFKLCAAHRDELIAQGLPYEAIERAKHSHPKCKATGCDLSASCDGKTYCKKHSISGMSDDTRQCEVPGCNKKRPTFGFDGMKKTRCREHKEDGMVSRKTCEDENCNKSASYGLHGGVVTHCKTHSPPGSYLLNNRMCVHEECKKQPIFGNTGDKIPTYCKAHAPDGFVDVKNKRCEKEGCDKLSVDSTAFCVSHGGGKTCSMACCANGGPRPQYRNPDDMTWICAFAARILMETAYMDDDNRRVRMLMEHFGRKSIMVLNQQSAFRTEIENMYWPKLDTCCDIIFDHSVLEKPKSLKDYRPDIFYKWCIEGRNYGIHIEYDEGSGHEDDDARLKWIADSSGTAGRVYVIRVRDSNSKGNLCNRCQRGSVVYFEMNSVGKGVAKEVAEAVMHRIEWIKNGLAPDESAQRQYKRYM